MSKQILYVEDKPAHATMVKDWLTDNGFEVNVAGTGEDALKEIEKKKPDLVLLDIILPKISGIEVCRRLKENSNSRNIPVLMLSAAGAKEVKHECEIVGADGFMDKPFGPKELVAKIKELLGIPE